MTTTISRQPTAFAVTMSALTLAAGSACAESALKLRLLSPACETALALSAGPESIQAEAGVYLLGEHGYAHRPRRRSG